MADEAAAGWPSAQYQAGIARGERDADPAQQAVLAELDRLYHALREPPHTGWWQRLRARAPQAIPGLYLWGGVGRGKTFLVDLLYDHLPLPALGSRALGLAPARVAAGALSGGKYRTHFHRFMQMLHALLREHAGERDPLAAIVARWRGLLRVLVLDEFFVSDIGDAMLLARLLERLFAEGIVLVTTSNSVPADLYRDGLQRARFLPAIALIEEHCHVLHLDSATDYRLRALTASPVYRTPLDADSETWLAARWVALGGGGVSAAGEPGAAQRHIIIDGIQPGAGQRRIIIDGRPIAVRARAPGRVWFDFAALCDGPRSAGDYIHIADEFHTVLVGGIVRMDGEHDDRTRRFITLIDELYERHVNLVCTAAAEPPALYGGQRLAFAFARTASRLMEMRGAGYLAHAHHRAPEPHAGDSGIAQNQVYPQPVVA